MTAPDTRRGARSVAPWVGNHRDGDEALATNLENPADEPKPDAPTRELAAVPAASGDRCISCEAPLVHDQRYCIQCGERRGQSTFPQPQPAAEVRTTRVRAAHARRPPRMSSGATLVSGVGVLLLAIGLGFLIGHSGKSTPVAKSAAAPEVITVQGGGGGSTAPASTLSTPTNAPSHGNGSSLTKKAQSKLKATAASKAVQKKATEAAGKVLGNGNNLPPPTVTTGGSCTSGQAGCQGGKFTGNFFGQ